MADKTNPTSDSISNFLPRYYRTDANKKFLQATIEQLTKPGKVKKVNGYIGRRNSKASTGNDIFVAEVSSTRENYQLEPGLVIKDEIGSVSFFKDYQDYINQLGVLGSNTGNHSRINKQEFYAWNPHINWDKFVNFQQYYWLPYGPDTITIYGQQKAITSTYTVKWESAIDSKEYVFTPNGLSRNPTLKLFRGQTYHFEIDSPGEPFSIKTARSTGSIDRYRSSAAVDKFAVEKGTVTFTVPDNAPNVLYYVSENDINLGGVFHILDIKENTEINVETELLGKKTYSLPTGLKLSNGMKIRFGGNVIPETYATGEYYVEGVGTEIALVSQQSLELIFPYTSEETVLWDDGKFDMLPYGSASSYAGSLDYITINRASRDKNPWSRYNRWFHQDVVTASAEYNGNIPSLNQAARAVRPIIEFDANLKLFNFGLEAGPDVDLIDTFTKDVFSTIEGSEGYNVDGVPLVEGHRILFAADSDQLANNRIYRVHFINVQDSIKEKRVRQIHLVLESEPVLNQVVVVKSGITHQGTMFWFNGTNWLEAQNKLTLNQPPLFDVVDANGYSLGDTTVYDGSTFTGTKVFSYKEGTGSIDSNLGFALSYKNINNTGDIVFNFNAISDTFQYKEIETIITGNISTGYFVRYLGNGQVDYDNGWEKSEIDHNYQPAIRVYKNSNLVNNFQLDIFDNKSDLLDLELRVYINGIRLDKSKWSVVDGAVYKIIVLESDISLTDVLTIKAFAAQAINANGYYEIPINLQNNPLNDSMIDFTLGEVIDHVNSIVENTDGFLGSFPGTNNLRDLGNVSKNGTKFVQHSGPLSLGLYHVTSTSNNVIKALEKSRDDYGSFKRNFITVAENLGIDTDTKQFVDLILLEINKDKPNTSPYYFSDMIPYTSATRNDFEVIDYRIKTYPLSSVFNLEQLSNKAVGVYVNSVQLLYGINYTFNSEGFVVINSDVLNNGDIVTIYEYDNTDGSFVPPTPTKLGLWPKYEPKIYLDTTLVTPRLMIQGHDGSQVLAYGDYRDQLILELEKRIFNNIKVEYDTTIFDVTDIIPGYNRVNDYSIEEFTQTLAPSFFKWASLVDTDFTKPFGFDSENTLTFNYRGHQAPDGREVPGYWRGIYRWMLDTDRPNLCPWEMLGYSIQPTWWETVYGPAPYTNDNKILWQDLSEGIIREPGKPVLRNPKYARPFLVDSIPVDESGNIQSPLLSNLASGVITTDIQGDYVFGDVGPVENSWRRSSYYPFSVLLVSMLLTPAKTFGLTFDRSRIVRNLTGQIVYKDTNLRVRPADVVIPNTYSSSTRTSTAGLVNYVVDYILSDNLKSYNQYVYDLNNINFNLSYRVGGFTSKEKFNLLLDSKNPTAVGGVFIPQENYNIILNSSSPVKKITYSGVIITKLQAGYEVKGYSKTQPYFKYYPWIQAGGRINVGGISESYSSWSASQRYVTGKVVKYNGQFYRTTVTHTSTNEFNTSNFQKLSGLPIVGGRDAQLRKLWDRTEEILVPYGTTFRTVQEVVDFLLGYGEWLKDQGFIFDDFNNNLATVTNWETSVKEFLFWTTQNWSAGQDKWSDWESGQIVEYNTIVRYNGTYYRALRTVPASEFFDLNEYEEVFELSTVGSSVISLSPAAGKITLKTDFTVVDDILNPFNGYEIFKVDGTKIEPNFLDSYRQDNRVSYAPRVGDGIYGATFFLVQKEQVLILDNTTLFNDTIYNPESGYRQERIKVSSYVSTNWYGGFDVPGFIFDQAKIQIWNPWTDYALGDTVKYKEFYYSAKSSIVGGENFVPDEWYKLSEEPKSTLLPNWTYKASQFEDFFSLDSGNFDVGQQKMAQHYIGYQKRQYLDNIIQNDVSEFKFYQGMIIEKGTQNVLNKLFDVLSAEDKESLKFYEEWAIRVGQYGATAAFEEIEFVLDESQFKNNPQGFELVQQVDSSVIDFVIRQTPNDVYLKPLGYNNDPWPMTSDYDQYLRTPGYVRSEDVALVLDNIDAVVTYSPSSLTEGDYIWCAFEGREWNIYRLTDSDCKILNLTKSGTTLTITLDRVVPYTVGSFVGITQVTGATGFFKILTVTVDKFTVQANSETPPHAPFDEQSTAGLFFLKSVRASSIDQANSIIPTRFKDNEKIWTDTSTTEAWAVWNHEYVYNVTAFNNTTPVDDGSYARTLAVAQSGYFAIVSTSTNVAISYDRVPGSQAWLQRQIVFPPFIFKAGDTSSQPAGYWAESMAISSDSVWAAIGSPNVGQAAVPAGSNQTDISGTRSGLTRQGTVSIYKKDSANTLVYQYTIVSPAPASNEKFGSKIAFGSNRMFVTTAIGKVYVYDYNSSNDTWEDTGISLTNPNTNFGYDISVATDNLLAVSQPDSGVVSLFTLDESANISAVVNITKNDGTGFGQSISITPDGEYLAVGSKLYDEGSLIDQGEVLIYKNGILFQTIKSTRPEIAGFFGAKVSFSNNGKTLAIYSANADSYKTTTFNVDGVTTFDNNSMQFIETQVDSGRVDVYDRYNTTWIYGESLDVEAVAGDQYGSGFTTGNNIILVGAPNADFQTINAGKFFSYIKENNKFSWTLARTQQAKPDVSKIKKAFLYNKKTNKLLSYIDVIDPIQGKIPGPADQEIKFKTFYDPATYSVGNDSVVVDEGQAWTDTYVGTLWWDLNRAKFLDAYGGDVVYRNSIWNTLFPTASIDVYEWVSTSLLPNAWDKIADTEAGLVQGISGTSLYGNSVYSIKRRYDSISQSYKNTYYYWVKNKKTIPDARDRMMSASDVSNLISNPKGQGYQYLALTASNSFSLVNVQPYLQHADVVLAVQYWTAGQTDQNIHSEWRLISDDPNTSLPDAIESKWFDSLCGKDENNREVPDLGLPPKLRYGIQSRPRQSMFVNRFEALKQFVERANSILIQHQIVNTRNITGLNSYDPEPSIVSGLYDVTVDTDAELRFASVSTVRLASIAPIVVDGYITGIDIIDAGNGYVTAPYITVIGNGENAVLRSVINSKGQITGVEIINKGRGYDSTTQLILRNFSVLVHSDSQALNRWSIYAYDPVSKIWSRSQTQAYDTRNYWAYADWYDTGINQFTTVDFLINTVADLANLTVKVGQLVKVKTSGTGGWLLLKKYADSTSIDWTQSYSVIGSQNGTVQLKDSLYKFADTILGFDGALFDSDTYDNTAVIELRVILNSLKNNILIDTLKQSYLDLFFVCLRYAFAEQSYIDWAFKTSFVRAQHNVGPLKEKVTYSNDNLADYQAYIEEVKPYRTKIREYVSSYSNVDTSQASVTDFDILPVRIDNRNESIVLTNVDGDIQANLPEILEYPWKHWLDNVGFEITELVLVDKGSGYVTEPVVRFEGGWGSGATARAFIANGKVNRIILLTKGKGYLAAPVVHLDGGILPDGVKATAVAKIGNSVVRSNLIKIKFDRVSQTYFITELSETETFTGTGSQLQFLLKWGPDVRIGKSRVTIDGVEDLRDNYTLSISTSTARGYTSYYGKLTFVSAPAKGSVIEITYIKDWSLLSAADRIQYYYTPTAGQPGRDLAQLMSGVDYGGVVVTGLDFSISSGWDSLPYFSDAWDSIDPTFEDYIIRAGLNSNVFTLPYIPTAGTEINIYHNGTRIDDPNFGTANPVTNKNATMQTFVGDGINSEITLPSISVTKTVTASEAVGSTSITVADVTGIQLNSLILSPTVIPQGTVVTGITGIISIATGTGTINGTTLTMPGLTTNYIGMRVTGNGVAPDTYITSVTTDVASINEVQTINVSGTASGAVRFLGIIIPASSSGDSAADTVLKIAAGRTVIMDGWNAANPTKELENIEIDFTNSGSGSTKLKLTYKNTEGNVPTIPSSTSSNITFATSVTLVEGVAGAVATAQVTVNQTVSSTQFTYIPIVTISNALLSSIADAQEIYFDDAPQYTLGVQPKGTDKISVTTAFGITVGSVLTTPVPLLTTTAIPVNTEVIAIDPVTNIITISKPLTGTLSNSVELSFGYNKLYFRKSTSDGSIKPLDTDYDTSIEGGDLAYTSARGIAADDIIIDGDGFVTPTTSPATEEVVPGQITDAVAIKVFYRPTTGSAQIKVDNYITTGIDNTYDITQFPNSKQAIIVKLNNTIIEADDYILDYPAKTLKLKTVPPAETFVSIFSFGFNGENVLDIDYFVGDGTTTEFVTKAPFLEIFSSLVYVNGEPVVYETFKTDETYEGTNKVAIRFIDAPALGDVINYVIVQSTQQTFATFRTEMLAPDGANRIFSLQNKIGTSVPLSNSVIVRVNQQILKPAPVVYFKIYRNKLNYQIDQTHMLPYEPDSVDFTVYADGTELVLGRDYTIDLAGITVTINKGIYGVYKNKTLTVVISKGSEYVCNQNTITFTTAPAAEDLVEVISAYQHDILDVRRTNLNIVPDLVYEPDSIEFYDYVGLTSGLIKLDRPVVDDSYVWITKNGTLLTPSIDFKLNSDYQSVQLALTPVETDKFEIITYSNNVHKSTMSYMQFKDMLNRTHFKRLPLKKQTKLKKDLNYYDTTIEVEDASSFDIPNPTKNRPGVVEIYGERIEYLVKDGNRLRQLRRGTLGTGTPAVHLSGTAVQDIGPSETIPYQDTISIEQISANGTNLVTVKNVPEKSATAWTFDKNFVSSIPSNYGQNDTLEVFVGGYDTGTAWLPNIDYTAGTIVSVGSYLYRALVDHTSSAKFTTDMDKWQFFIGNIRLKKHPFKVYNVNIHPDSPDGDIQMDPDFAVDGETNTIRLTNDLAEGTTVTVVKKTGRLWTGITFNPTPLTLDSDTLILDSGVTTLDSREADAAINSGRQIVEFLKQEPGIWPGQQTYKLKTIPSTFDSDGGTFDGTEGTFDRG